MGATELSLPNANAVASMLTNNAGLGNFGSEHIHRVAGVEGMVSFQTKPSSDYALFEENSDIFGVKVTDASNNATLRYFKFSEITKEEAIREISPFVMKGELDALKEDMLSAIKSEMSHMKEEILNAQQSVRTKQSTGYSTGDPIEF